jgi:electron transport complex protein RnfB
MPNEAHRLEIFPRVAIIDEQLCIGCTKCIPPCPVDAIVGSAKHLHTVIASECTGCGLCVAPCPVDCIALQPLPRPFDDAQLQQKIQLAENRHHAQLLRRANELAAQQQRAEARKAALLAQRMGK